MRSDEMAERHGRVLTELCELGMDMARGLKARADAAESREDAEALALAFHRVARSVRLTLALESRLARERFEIGKQEEVRASLQAAERRRQVRAVVARDVWRESEGEAAEALIEELDERLALDSRFEAFRDGPVEALIARIRSDLGLAANDARPAPEPPAAPPAEAPPEAACEIPERPPRDDAGDDFWSAPWRSSG
jgi:hypothetical protein